jgi:hypothetical protein
MIQIIVLLSGISAIAAVFVVSTTIRDSETSLLYAALASYIAYALSSAALSFSITTRPRPGWAATHLFFDVTRSATYELDADHGLLGIRSADRRSASYRRNCMRIQ